MKCLIMGDVHCYFKTIKYLKKILKPEIILQVGDFGIWPDYNLYKEHLKYLEDNETPIYFCDGNHEDFGYLSSVESGTEIIKNCFYMRRGSTITLPDGRNVLFFGGAESTDKHLRTPGIDWFPEESISIKDMHNLPEKDTKLDIVISHTCPDIIHNDMVCLASGIKLNSGSSKNLQTILEMFSPKLWYFGHWHLNANGIINNTKWFCVDDVCSNKGWIWLE